MAYHRVRVRVTHLWNFFSGFRQVARSQLHQLRMTVNASLFFWGSIASMKENIPALNHVGWLSFCSWPLWIRTMEESKFTFLSPAFRGKKSMLSSLKCRLLENRIMGLYNFQLYLWSYHPTPQDPILWWEINTKQLNELTLTMCQYVWAG